MKGRLTVLVIGLCTGMHAYASCGSAACSMNTSFETQGIYTGPGVRFDARYEFIQSDQLRLGTDKVVKQGEFPLGAHNVSRTINRSLVLSVDVSITPKFGISAALPLLNRHHYNQDFPFAEIGDEGAIVTAQALPATRVRPQGHLVGVFPEGHQQTWRYEGIGDLRVVGRYQLFSKPRRGGGLTFGTRLPTAPNDIKADDGLEPDKAVQPGAGSVDLILGGYYYTQLSDVSSGFLQLSAQGSVYHYPDFRPSNVYALDLGYRRLLDNYWGFQGQINIQHRGHEGGRFGLASNSGADEVYLSPGVTYEFSEDLQFYGFFQQPVYRHYDGAQVTPDWAAAAGISYRY